MARSYSPYVGIAWVVIVNVVAYLLNEHSILKSCWSKRRRTTFYSTNRAYGVAIEQRPSTWFAFDLHDANHLVQSWLVSGKAGTVLVLLFRIFAGAYFVLTMLVIEYEGAGLEPTFLKYFTHWTLVLMGMYAVLGAYICLRQLFRRGVTAAARSYGFADKCFALCLVSSASCAVFLTAFYWAVLYDPDAKHYVDNPLKHGGNVIVMWLDYLISRTPVNGYWFQFVLLYTSVYAAFMWIYSTVGDGKWPYDSLDWHKDSAAGYYIVLPILVFIGFALTYLVAGLREFLYRRKCCCMCCPCSCCGSACREEAPQFNVTVGPPPVQTMYK